MNELHSRGEATPDAVDDKRGEQLVESTGHGQLGLEPDIESLLNTKEEARLRLKIDWYICPVSISSGTMHPHGWASSTGPLCAPACCKLIVNCTDRHDPISLVLVSI